MLGIGFGLSALLYAAATVLHLSHLKSLTREKVRQAHVLEYTAVGVHLVTIVLLGTSEGMDTLGHRACIPTLVALILCMLALVVRDPFGIIGSHVSPVAAVVQIATLLGLGATQEATAPHALSTVSLVHISASALGFLGFAVAYTFAALHTAKDARLRAHVAGGGLLRLPSLQRLERTMYAVLAFSFVLYTAGAALGSTMSSSGASIPSHLPFAILSWLCFAAVLGLRWFRGWAGRRAALLVMGGFVGNLAVALAYYFKLA